MDALLKQAISAARRAGEEIMRIYTGEYTVATKADRSVVTQADIRADEIIRKELAQTNIPVLSEEKEEAADSRLSSERVWIVDPLDGTRDFIEKTGDFVVMIGLAQAGKPILGVVYAPAHDVLYCGSCGGAAYKVSGGEEALLAVSTEDQIKNARVVVSRSHFSDEIKQLLAPFNQGKTKRVGSNGIKLGLIAAGEADVFFTPTDKLGEWDMCAPQAVLEAAGGTVTSISGDLLVYNKATPTLPGGVLATNGTLHEPVLTTLNQNYNF